VKTYAHTLKRFEEDLADRATRRDELQRRVEEKRRELLAARRLELRESAFRDPQRRRELEELDAAYQIYAEEPSTPAGFAEADIAPLPPDEAEIIVRARS
jgi:hypothetical protein